MKNYDNIAYAATTVNNETELRNAINAGETEITIGNDFSSSETIEIKDKGNLTINGNDKTISNGEAEKLQLFKIEGSKVTFENITLDGNQKTQGIWLEKSDLVLRNVKVNNFISIAKPGDLPNGGAIYALDSNVDISGSTFENNKSLAGGSGGAIFFAGDSSKNMTVTGSTFIKNSNFKAESPQNTGGAIHFQSKLESGGRPTLEVTGSIFQIGTPFNTGGGIRLLDAVATVSKTEFKIDDLPDRYGVSGGGICSENSELTLTESKFTAAGTSKIAFAGGFVDIVESKGTSNISMEHLLFMMPK